MAERLGISVSSSGFSDQWAEAETAERDEERESSFDRIDCHLEVNDLMEWVVWRRWAMTWRVSSRGFISGSGCGIIVRQQKAYQGREGEIESGGEMGDGGVGF